jgi:hypothetical protein
MDNIIKALVQDLSGYSPKDIQLLARYYKVPKDLQIIARHNLGERFQAQMYGKTYHTDQISDVVNILNAKFIPGRNICLRTALVITHFTDNPSDDYFTTMHLDIKPQAKDIYTVEQKQGITTGTTDTYLPMIEEISNVDAPRYCFFVVWVKRDGYKRETPVLDTHMSLVLCKKTADHNYDVYKYNSGIVDERTEDRLDMSIRYFFKLVQEQSCSHHFNIICTTSWCPLHLQGTSNLCTVFVFHIYYYLNMLRIMPIKDIIKELQNLKKIRRFIMELSALIPGTGAEDIYGVEEISDSDAEEISLQ